MKRGYDVFGRAYGVMLRNDVHAEGSVDDMLVKNMMLLDDESEMELYSRVHMPDVRSHELYGFAQRFREKTEKESVEAVLRFTSGIVEKYDVDFQDMRFGGTEREIIERGTDWCADMARVGAVLIMCLGIPCRLVNLVNLEKAYNGHVACEAFYEGKYGFIDPLYGYRFGEEKPLSVIEIMRDKAALSDKDEYYRGLFSAAAISEYDPTDPKNDYTVSTPNEYTSRIIYEDHDGRWFMGEDGK